MSPVLVGGERPVAYFEHVSVVPGTLMCGEWVSERAWECVNVGERV